MSPQNTFRCHAPVSEIKPQIIYGHGDKINDFVWKLRKAESGIFGYYGISGIGKTCMLLQLARIADSLGAYVVYLDFSPAFVPALQTLVDVWIEILQQLAHITHSNTKTLRELSKLEKDLRKPRNSRSININVQTIISRIEAQNSHLTDLAVSSGGNLDQNFRDARESYSIFSIRLAKLIRSFPRRLNCLHNHFAGKEKPMVVLLIDSLEYAQSDIKSWLINFQSSDLASEVLVVACGRDPIPRLLSRELQEVGETEAFEMLQKRYSLSLREIESLIALCQGIPSALLTAASYLQDFPEASLDEMMAGGREVERNLVSTYLVERYLARLEEEIRLHPEDVDLPYIYYMLKFGSVLRRWDGAEQLRLVFMDLPATGKIFDGGFDFDQALGAVRKCSLASSGQLHTTVRELAVRRLQRQDNELLQEIHVRARDYYLRKNNEVEATYHQLAGSHHDREEIVNRFREHIRVANFDVAAQFPLIFDSWSIEARLMYAQLAINGKSGESHLDALLAPDIVGSFEWKPWRDALLRDALDKQCGNALFRAQATLSLASSSEEKASALADLGEQLFLLSRHTESLYSYEEARQIYEDMGNLARLGDVAVSEGRVYAIEGDWDEAQSCFEQALEIFGNDRLKRSRTLMHLGEKWYLQKEYQQAEQHLMEALQLCAKHHTYQRGFIHLHLGYLYQKQNMNDLARTQFEEALTLLPAGPIELSRAIVLNELGAIAEAQGHLEAALSNFKMAKDSYPKIYTKHRAGNLNKLANILRRLGKITEVEDYLWQAMVLDSESPVNRGETYLQLGHVAWARGDLETATERYKESLKLLEGSESLESIAHAYLGLARIARRQGSGNEALEHYSTSLSTFVAARNTYGQALVLSESAEYWLEVGDVIKAQDCIDQLKYLCQENVRLRSSYHVTLEELRARIRSGRE